MHSTYQSFFVTGGPTDVQIENISKCPFNIWIRRAHAAAGRPFVYIQVLKWHLE